MKLFVNILFCLLLNSLFVFSHNSGYGNIGPEIHSWNDHREWPSLFQKMTIFDDSFDRWIKLDINFAEPTLAKTIPGCKNSGNEGCLVLTHNNPVENVDYSTPKDLWAFLSSEPVLQQLQYADYTTYIDFCVKHPEPPCDGFKLKNDNTTLDWFDLYSDLVQEGTQIISSLNLNVNFVMDGDVTPGGSISVNNTKYRKCLSNKFQPYPSTFLFSKDPEKALTSNDPTYGFNRFQVLNIWADEVFPTLFFDILRDNNYGKFLNGSYPFLVWEPSWQKDFLTINEHYLKGKPHSAGIRYAINIDPIMFEVYNANYTGRALNYEIAPQHKNSLILDLTIDDSVEETKLLIVSKNSENNVEFNFLLSNNILNGFQEKKTLYTLKNYYQYSSISQKVLNNEQSLIFFVQSNGQYNLFLFNQNANTMELVVSGLFPNLNIEYMKSCNAEFVVNANQEQQFIIQTYAINSIIYVQLLKYELDLDRKMFNLLTFGNEIQIIDNQLNNKHIDSLDISSFIESQTLNYFLLAATSEQKIYSFLSQAPVQNANSQDDIVKTNKLKTIYNEMSLIAYGTDASSSIFNDENDQLTIFYTHSNGTCWNNELANKDQYILVCDQKPTSSPFIMNYAIGTFQNFKNSMQNNELLNPCNKKIVVGTFSLGLQPENIVIKKNSKFYSLITHNGLKKTDVDSTSCGSPSFFDGILLDGFPLPQVIYQ
ncbi:hypothetical protein M0812_26633 [Anaeramoeba flamelloides]|uniref:Uncharacterized protein n=1 Tax=Anaeramoeba flamelloides TaxID=1746091 RepID=A0AAV7YDL7_9EUKA|nr:hypothetical protein M0812_26633 [Anaeramoeba flamelloides]